MGFNSLAKACLLVCFLTRSVCQPWSHSELYVRINICVSAESHWNYRSSTKAWVKALIVLCSDLDHPVAMLFLWSDTVRFLRTDFCSSLFIKGNFCKWEAPEVQDFSSCWMLLMCCEWLCWLALSDGCVSVKGEILKVGWALGWFELLFCLGFFWEKNKT